MENGEGQDVVLEIMLFSTEGRTAKQEPIIFALALCARLGLLFVCLFVCLLFVCLFVCLLVCSPGDTETKKSAYKALPKVCRIPTHLFSFIEYCESLSKGTGWGRSHRRAVADWFVIVYIFV